MAVRSPRFGRASRQPDGPLPAEQKRAGTVGSDPATRRLQLGAQMPTRAAFALRHRLSLRHPYPDTERALVGPPGLDRQDRARRQAHHLLGHAA
jgi:hypothetical protein